MEINSTATHRIDPPLTLPPIELLDLEPAAADVRAEVIAGLSMPQKQLPCKLLYDEKGSQLFDAICELPEYYQTRTELSIMHAFGRQISDAIGPRALLVEYGSGSSIKTRVLLDRLRDVAGYVPIDIASEHLMDAARSLAASYPGLPIRPICADYTKPFPLPKFELEPPRRTVAYFPGSTIGNFEAADALAFLQSIRATCGPGSGLLIGVDLIKDPAALHAAYNDSAGVTAAFNLNLLTHLNRSIGSNFDLSQFAHYAFYQPAQSRIEMHLISRRRQTVRISDRITIELQDGESIHTESCCKYTLDRFARLANAAGYAVQNVWVDPQARFSVQYLIASTPTDARGPTAH